MLQALKKKKKKRKEVLAIIFKYSSGSNSVTILSLGGFTEASNQKGSFETYFENAFAKQARLCSFFQYFFIL